MNELKKQLKNIYDNSSNYHIIDYGISENDIINNTCRYFSLNPYKFSIIILPILKKWGKKIKI